MPYWKPNDLPGIPSLSLSLSFSFALSLSLSLSLLLSISLARSLANSLFLSFSLSLSLLFLLDRSFSLYFNLYRRTICLQAALAEVDGMYDSKQQLHIIVNRIRGSPCHRMLSSLTQLARSYLRTHNSAQQAQAARSRLIV